MNAFLTPQQRFGIVCALAYVALAWAVRVDTRFGQLNASLVYPLDTFSMYSEMPQPGQTGLLLLDAGGGVHRIGDFGSFACDAPVRGPYDNCPPLGLRHKTDELLRRIELHRMPDRAQGEPMALVARTWRLRPGEVPVLSDDCRIARCAVLR